MVKKVMRKYQGGGGTTAADKVAAQRAANEKRKAEAQARTTKSKSDAATKISTAQGGVTAIPIPAPNVTPPASPSKSKPISIPWAKPAEIGTKTVPIPIEKKGGTITALDQVDRMEKAKLLKGKR
tara:strand:+ start:532 stop:906 length:375 start_codon:yes stop_codon:yes gene_type:complete